MDRKIERMDKFLLGIPHPTFLGLGKRRRVVGRIVHSASPQGLFTFDPEDERMPTATELMLMRIMVVASILDTFPLLEKLVHKILSGTGEYHRREMAEVYACLPLINDVTGFCLWQYRLTTTTHLIRWKADGEDLMLFYDGELPCNYAGVLSDGGVRYPGRELKKIRSISRALPYSQYLTAKGGTFTGSELAEHPVFGIISADQKLWHDYITAMQVLDVLDFYHQGAYSGWLPANMKHGFGRAISLGFKGDGWYPPNNGTLGHATVLIPADLPPGLGL